MTSQHSILHKLCDNIVKIKSRRDIRRLKLSWFFVLVMESERHVCQTCGLQFASAKARNMHEVRVHAKSTRCAVNDGKL